MATLDQRKLFTINDLGARQARKPLQFNDLQRGEVGTILEYLRARLGTLLEWHDSRPGTGIE
jgi:hypothetical protein